MFAKEKENTQRDLSLGISNLDPPKCPYSMNNTHRFQFFTEAVNFLMDNHNMSNQEATHFVWCNQFTIGTDRAVWITIPVDLGL